MYQLTDDQRKQLEVRFSYHPPKDTQWERYGAVRDGAKEYARLLMECCPESRELSLALTALDSCMMNANAAIARNE